MMNNLDIFPNLLTKFAQYSIMLKEIIVIKLKKFKKLYDTLANAISLKRIPKKLETFDFEGIRQYLLTNWLSKDYHELVMWTAKEIQEKTQTNVQNIIDISIDYYKIKRNVEEYKKAIMEFIFKNKRKFFDTNINSIYPGTKIKINLDYIRNKQIQSLDKLLETYAITSLKKEMKYWNKSWLGEKTGDKINQEQIEYLDKLYKKYGTKKDKSIINPSRITPNSQIEKE